MRENILKIDQNQSSIAVRDPLMVRADLVIRDAGRLGAIVDGMIFDLGLVDDHLVATFANHAYIEIRADHFDGGVVRRRVPVVHH